jgi:predicted DNA-binding transcriptional regulator AlpA
MADNINFSNPYEALFTQMRSIEQKIETLKVSFQPPPQKEEERFLDTKQVAELYGVSTVSIWQWEKANILKSYRIGNLKRFKYSELLESPKLIQRSK